VATDRCNAWSRRFQSHAYLLGSYRIATAPERNSSRLTSLESTYFEGSHDVLLKSSILASNTLEQSDTASPSRPPTY
jgi:hypothetical protein